MFNRISFLLVAPFPVFVSLGTHCAAQIRFEVVDIDPHIGEVCYAVTAVDVDGDGASDIVALSESAAYWYRSPDWKKFTMVDGVLPRDHVCIAAEDINRDGKIDFAIGAGWPQNGGSIYWIERGALLDQPWLVHEIGAERSTHRMRFADVLGRGEPQLVVSPLNGSDGLGARLQAFPIPSNPGVDPWIPVVLDGSLNWIAVRDIPMKVITKHFWRPRRSGYRKSKRNKLQLARPLQMNLSGSERIQKQRVTNPKPVWPSTMNFS